MHKSPLNSAGWGKCKTVYLTALCRQWPGLCAHPELLSGHSPVDPPWAGSPFSPLLPALLPLRAALMLPWLRRPSRNLGRASLSSDAIPDSPIPPRGFPSFQISCPPSCPPQPLSGFAFGSLHAPSQLPFYTLAFPLWAVLP